MLSNLFYFLIRKNNSRFINIECNVSDLIKEKSRGLLGILVHRSKELLEVTSNMKYNDIAHGLLLHYGAAITSSVLIFCLNAVGNAC
jgi:hypothetical protein